MKKRRVYAVLASACFVSANVLPLFVKAESKVEARTIVTDGRTSYTDDFNEIPEDIRESGQYTEETVKHSLKDLTKDEIAEKIKNGEIPKDAVVEESKNSKQLEINTYQDLLDARNTYQDELIEQVAKAGEAVSVTEVPENFTVEQREDGSYTPGTYLDETTGQKLTVFEAKGTRLHDEGTLERADITQLLKSKTKSFNGSVVTGIQVNAGQTDGLGYAYSNGQAITSPGNVEAGKYVSEDGKHVVISEPRELSATEAQSREYVNDFYADIVILSSADLGKMPKEGFITDANGNSKDLFYTDSVTGKYFAGMLKPGTYYSNDGLVKFVAHEPQLQARNMNCESQYIQVFMAVQSFRVISNVQEMATQDYSYGAQVKLYNVNYETKKYSWEMNLPDTFEPPTDPETPDTPVVSETENKISESNPVVTVVPKENNRALPDTNEKTTTILFTSIGVVVTAMAVVEWDTRRKLRR
jgi:hypothetical protein